MPVTANSLRDADQDNYHGPVLTQWVMMNMMEVRRSSSAPLRSVVVDKRPRTGANRHTTHAPQLPLDSLTNFQNTARYEQRCGHAKERMDGEPETDEW